MATKSTNKTIWTVGLVAVLVYAAWKVIGQYKSKSGGGGSPYVPGGISPDDYAPYQQPQSPGLSLKLGGGGGGGSNPNGQALGPDSPYGGPLSIADALADGYAADGVSQDILAGFYNEGQGYGYYSDTTPQSIFNSIFGEDNSTDDYQLPEQGLESFDTSGLATDITAPGAFVDSSDDGSTASVASFDDTASFDSPVTYDASGDLSLYEDDSNGGGVYDGGGDLSGSDDGDD